MNCVIIDHNKMFSSMISQMASNTDDLCIRGEFDNVFDAFNYLQINKVDLLFLEIEMPGISGIEFVRNLRNNNMVVVFTASKTDYAAEAYELSVSDYLLKPISSERFLKAVNKAREILMLQRTQVSKVEDDYLFIRDSLVVRKIKTEDILYAQANGDYVQFYTDNKLYMIHGKLKNAELRLDPSKFIRIHRSYIISLTRIETVEDGGVTINGQFLPVAEAYKKDLFKRINLGDAPVLLKYG